MYIELGSTRINYTGSIKDDFIILSQVVDSPLSYEKPVIVRTTEELDIWFGREFSDRDYLLELLESGISLYLYKPVSSDTNNDQSITDFIDYSNYTESDTIIYESDLDKIDKKENVIYKVRSFSDEVVDYILYPETGELIPIKILPQNQISYNTQSLNNRDTLIIFKDGKYLSPGFITNISSNEFGSFRELSNENSINISDVNFDRVCKNYQTCVYNLCFDEENLFKTIDNELNYLVFNNTLYGFCTKKDDLEEGGKFYKEWESLENNIGFDENIIIVGVNSNKRDLILNCFGISDDKLILEKPEDVSYFYNISGFSMESDFNYTNDLIYNTLIKTETPIIGFVSKTIGTGDIDGYIEVEIENPVDDIYRISLGRFGYTESFEGTIQGTKDNLSLEELVNRYSKLVNCEIKDTELLTGKWVLRGGIKENNTEDMYLKSLTCLCNPPEPIYFDYLLIPDIDRFPTDITNEYYSIYNTLLDISKNIGCQILIQNSIGQIIEDYSYILTKNENTEELNDAELTINNINFVFSGSDLVVMDPLITEYKKIDTELILKGSSNISKSGNDKKDLVIKQGNYYYNYVNDLENRLIYFYGSMNILGNNRPGYYLYLMGLLSQDTYSATSDTIYYQTPTEEYYINLFKYNNTEEKPLTGLDLVKELDKRKCNYLLSNNHIYYYEKYQNGSSYVTTGWVRFCIEKIKRELVKNKWLIIDSRDYSSIKNNIELILNRIKNSFSIIRDIKLADLEISYKDKKIDIKIDSYVSDLVNNSIRIDVTLNFNA